MYVVYQPNNEQNNNNYNNDNDNLRDKEQKDE
ncbi:hypothetical protein T11_11938 [Trichinella zimbabwensis]|uniref:Uncharacterized protein n=1 Tax=Trichinella zimbabwensis TaxID=268475 RepID=A0A0V1G766_9BILA|nr:hypothetical protein T11_11938 [Trichinella zimbabwensis]